MTKNKFKKLIITCGGTGGHFFPGFTIARTFNDKKKEVLLITEGHKTHYKELYSTKYNIDINEVSSAKLSKSPLKNFIFILKFIKGFIQSLYIYIKFRPNAVLAMGSYTSLPSGFAALFLRIPLFLHDGNSKIGKANKLLSRWAKLLMLSFPLVDKKSIKCKTVLTGMPLRPEIINSKHLTKKELIEQLNNTFNVKFNTNKPVILIFGGSLGAKTINTVIPEAFTDFPSDIQIIHLTGKNDFTVTKSLYRKVAYTNLVIERSDEMALLYSVSDIIISRSGGSTISELAFFDKPAILIPYPHAAENHQYYNALHYTKTGIAEILENNKCTKEKISKLIEKFIEKFYNTKVASINLSLPNATDKIIKIISKNLN
ncbi:MAG: undecaprenyldiphospho-muramoylpentapeptide beta-N-acetylglucosaminyltransferase [bacterium]|nr:undecaprenyldiphospho-muramoylpentapeptide beta-N-acetylglucosaminyltransferase [bacterium]